MSFQIKPLGFNQVAVLYNGKHVQKFGGANAALDAREFVKKQMAQSIPSSRPAGLGARQVVDEMFNINSNIGRFEESMLEGFDADEVNDLIEKYVGFEKLAGELEGKGAKDPKALAAWIGRQKYGKKKYQKMSEANESLGLEEKHLTPAELKKREEIARAIGRENPEMDMSKKMAIATAQAKKVAESEELEEAVDMGRWMRDHDKLEDNNEHTKNMVRVANLVGDENDQKEMAGIAKRHDEQGSLSMEDSQARYKLHQKLWPKVEELHSNWKASRGMKEETQLGNEGTFKKSKETFKKAKQQDKQGNPAGSLEVTEGTQVDHNHPDYRYKKGQQINIRKEWQDEGDAEGNWHVAEDQDPRGGRVVIKSSLTKHMKIQPTHVVTPEMIEPKQTNTQESFADMCFDGEVISESITIALSESDMTYAGVLRALMEMKGIHAIAELESREARSEFIDMVESFASNKDYSCVLENYLRNDVEDRINKHRELGNKVSGASYSMKNGKPYAEFVVTTPEGVKKRYVFHGNTTRHEVISAE